MSSVLHSFVTASWAGEVHSRRPVEWHAHAEHELVFVKKGRCRIEVGQALLSGGAGTLFFLPARLSQRQSGSGTVQTLYVGFKGNVPWSPQDPFALLVPRGDPLRDWIRHVCSLFLSSPSSWHSMASPLLQACVARIADLSRNRPEALPPQLRKVMQGIVAQAHGLLDVGTLARESGLSSSHLRTLMRRHLRTSPMRQHREVVMEKARRLLGDPYLRVGEVAAACGFDDHNYFTRVFKKCHRLSPGQWRKSQGIGSRHFSR